MPTQPGTPDVVLLATDWQTRALIRAQLIEQGFDVAATDTWPAFRARLRPGAKPSLAIVDLLGLADPARVLHDLKILMPPHRVLVLTAIGTVTPDQVEQAGFRVMTRPMSIESVVTTVECVLKELGPARGRPF